MATPFRDALLAAVGDDPRALREIASSLIGKTVAGDTRAIKQIDRSDNPPKADVAHFARVHTRAAINTLVSVVSDEKATAAARMAAGVAILRWIARGSGKLNEVEFAAAISAMRYVAGRQLSARRLRKSAQQEGQAGLRNKSRDQLRA
jgi:gamma-glutamyl:cysteine ligase YbdK (ATP-grasp superfamily)